MADKSVTIKGATDAELDQLLIRLRKENEIQNLVWNLKRTASPISMPYDQQNVSTEDPIETLYHAGVMGMKWGVRRASLQGHMESHPSGKENRQAQNDARNLGKENKVVDKAARSSRHADMKNRRQLSDDELLAKIGRLEREKKLRELTAQELHAGREASNQVLIDVGKRVATTVIAGAALYAVQAALTKKFDLGELASFVKPKK